jgi:hypothetical protein
MTSGAAKWYIDLFEMKMPSCEVISDDNMDRILDQLSRFRNLKKIGFPPNGCLPYIAITLPQSFQQPQVSRLEPAFQLPGMQGASQVYHPESSCESVRSNHHSAADSTSRGPTSPSSMKEKKNMSPRKGCILSA